MSEDNEALIREIQQEVQREKWKKLWDQYGVMALSVVGAVLLIGAGWQWYAAVEKGRAERAGGQFYEATRMLDGDKKKDGLAGLEQIAKEGSPAYAVLAKLRLAAEARTAKETDKALKLYEEVAANSSIDSLLQSFASLQIASLKVDKGDWTEVQNRLNPLVDGSSPWRYSAQELLGVAAFKNGKWAEAKQAYEKLLGDTNTPAGMRQRAQMAMTLITRAELGTQKGKTNGSPAPKADLKKDKSGALGEPNKQAEPEKAKSQADAAGASSNGASTEDGAKPKTQ